MNHHVLLIIFTSVGFVLGVLMRRHPWWVLLAVVPLTALPIGAWRSVSIPKESDLTSVSGQITSDSALGSGERGLVFRLDAFPHALAYPDGTPRIAEVREVMKPRTEVTVWVLEKKSTPGVPSEVWRIDEGNRTVASYREIATARWRSARDLVLLGFSMVGISLGAILQLFTDAPQGRKHPGKKRGHSSFTTK